MNRQPISRRIAGICLIAAPALMLVGLVLTPYPTHAGTRGELDAAALHPVLTQVAAIAIEFGYVLLVPAVFGLIAETATAPRWLRRPGAVLGVVGCSILPGLLVTDIVNLTLAQQLPREVGVTVADHANSSAAAAIMATPGVVGAVIGTTFLVAAAWRSGIAPAWAAPVVIVGWIVGHPLAVVPATLGGTLLLLGYGSVGVKLLRAESAKTAAGHVATTVMAAP